MRKKNPITNNLRERGLLESRYVKTLPVYQKGDDVTYDVEDADKTPLGEPIQVDYSAKHITSHDVYDKTKLLSFNPKNPQARMLALEARAYVNNALTDSQVYMDKIEASTFANNVVDSFEKNLKSTKFK